MRKIYGLPTYERELVKFLRKHPDMENAVKITLRLLERDINFPSLKTHKLHGKLGKFYACSVNYNVRIVFHFDNNYVYLEGIGFHGEVY